MRATYTALALLLPLLLSGCATVPPSSCPPGAQAKLSAELIFGRNIGGRLGVSETDFARFVDAEVSPRFPDGFTLLDAKGQWREGAGRIVREPAKMLVVLAPDTPEVRAQLAAIAGAYKTRFRQEAVASVLKPACVAF